MCSSGTQAPHVKELVRFVTFFFFFSSRRRHTRSDRDWSSDVCSSDLRLKGFAAGSLGSARDDGVLLLRERDDLYQRINERVNAMFGDGVEEEVRALRSEERRVGKEGRSWWAPDH